MLKGVRCMSVLAAVAVLLPCAARAQDLSVRYDLPQAGDVRITTEVTVREPGSRSYRHALAGGSDLPQAQALDKTDGKALPHRVDGKYLVVEWPRALSERAERRLVIAERADRTTYVSERGQDLEFHHALAPGRIVLALPAGYRVSEVTAPAQLAMEDGRTKVGIVNDLSTPLPIRIRARKTGTGALSTAVPGAFRAEDERSIVYWLDDPATHRISLALELFLTHPGQSHAYSVLRDDDRITDPVSLDVDRGRELPTRIVKGREANKFGDSPTPFPDEANVLVADLGYEVPKGGSARVRLYQTATDAAGYRLQPDGELQWDRFLARLRTRAVLPEGWVLTSVDQPAVISRDDRGRIVIDFMQTGGDSPKLTLTARRSAPDATP